jgi:divalent metal cation (Fe/Co/Zn/Cd) transporter
VDSDPRAAEWLCRSKESLGNSDIGSNMHVFLSLPLTVYFRLKIRHNIIAFVVKCIITKANIFSAAAVVMNLTLLNKSSLPFS